MNKNGDFGSTGSVNSGLKVGLIVAVVVILVLGLLIGTIYKQKRDVTKALQNEKDLLVKDLNNLKLSYEAVIVSSDSVSLDLTNARRDVLAYIDSLKSARIDLSSVKSLKRQLAVLKEERSRLLRINDSLLRSNRLLTSERDSIAKLFNSQKLIADSLMTRSLEAAQSKKEHKLIDDIADSLIISSVASDGVIQKSTGKIKATPKAKKADRIRVCYIVTKRSKAPSAAPIKFYIVAKDSKGVVLGEKKTVTNETTGDSIVYTIISSFQYGKSAKLNVCDYVGPDAKNFTPGAYQITIYDTNLKEVGKSSVTLE